MPVPRIRTEASVPAEDNAQSSVCKQTQSTYNPTRTGLPWSQLQDTSGMTTNRQYHPLQKKVQLQCTRLPPHPSSSQQLPPISIADTLGRGGGLKALYATKHSNIQHQWQAPALGESYLPLELSKSVQPPYHNNRGAWHPSPQQECTHTTYGSSTGPPRR